MFQSINTSIKQMSLYISQHPRLVVIAVLAFSLLLISVGIVGAEGGGGGSVCPSC